MLFVCIWCSTHCQKWKGTSATPLEILREYKRLGEGGEGAGEQLRRVLDAEERSWEQSIDRWLLDADVRSWEQSIDRSIERERAPPLPPPPPPPSPEPVKMFKTITVAYMTQCVRISAGLHQSCFVISRRHVICVHVLAEIKLEWETYIRTHGPTHAHIHTHTHTTQHTRRKTSPSPLVTQSLTRQKFEKLHTQKFQ